jgi:hypothetical protein
LNAGSSCEAAQQRCGRGAAKVPLQGAQGVEGHFHERSSLKILEEQVQASTENKIDRERQFKRLKRVPESS